MECCSNGRLAAAAGRLEASADWLAASAGWLLVSRSLVDAMTPEVEVGKRVTESCAEEE